MNKNIFGEPLITCSTNPMTGYFRNGCCETDKSDVGLHTVCVIVTKEFLTFSKFRPCNQKNVPRDICGK